MRIIKDEENLLAGTFTTQKLYASEDHRGKSRRKGKQRNKERSVEKCVGRKKTNEAVCFTV